MCFLCNIILEMFYNEKVGFCTACLAASCDKETSVVLFYIGGSFLSSWRLQSLTKYRLSTLSSRISPSPLLMSEVTKYLFLNVSETNNKACHKTKDALLNVESRIGYLFKTRIILVTKKYISRMSKQNNVFFL